MERKHQDDFLRRFQRYLQQHNLFHLAFPPATAEQLRMTEELLGISLPPLLCTLYTQIANGGFRFSGGENARMSGILGGFHHETVDLLLKEKRTFLDYGFSFMDIEKAEEELLGNLRVLGFLPKLHPNQMFHLWSDSSYALYVHCTTGRIYLATDDYNGEVDINGEWVEGVMTWFRLRDSLEDWLTSWMRGETILDWIEELETLLLGKEINEHE
jgi:hypothetical protein